MTPDDVLKLTALLSQKIRDRRPDIATAVSYYKGTEGRMRFASDEFRDYFARRFAGFSDNWCMPVAQAPIERAHQRGIRLPGERFADVELSRTWERNDADRGLSASLLMMTIAKRSFGLVSPSPVGARITFEHPDSAAVIVNPQTRLRRAGFAMWQDDAAEYGSLYLPGSVLSMTRKKVETSNGDRYVPPDADGWTFDTSKGAVEVRNPLGEVPLVEFRNQDLLDNDPISDIAGVMAMQDSINLVWAYLLNALDYASLPQRIVTGAEVPKEPILDATTGQVVGSRPMELDKLVRERIMFIPGETAKTSEWAAASLEVYSKVIEQAVQHVAAQTRTPGHYLLSGSNVPATGYELSEAGLVSKASERIGYANPGVRDLYRLSALADGDTAKAKRVAVGKVLWKNPQYRDQAGLMDGLGKLRTVGFPVQWIAEEYGLEPDEVSRVMEMIRTEQQDPYLASLTAKAAPADVKPADTPPVG